MPEIFGTTGNDIINGTDEAETIRALGGNDTVNAGGGDDIIYGGTGADTLNGDDGNDTFVEDEFTLSNDIFNGGAGFDTIELRASAAPVITSIGAVTVHTLTGASSMSSIERMVFASQVGQVVLAQLSYSTWAASGLTQFVGGAGRDLLSFSTGTGAGIFSMPSLTLTGWDALPVNAWDYSGDVVTLGSSAPAGVGVTLNALASANFFQNLGGGSGNDTLNGSDNADSFDASRGGDAVNAGGGNDAIQIVNSSTPTGNGVTWNPPTTFTGAGGVWNGGAGTDVISIGGAVTLQATLVSIEGVNLLPGFFPAIANVARQDAAILTLDSAHIAMLPANAFFAGTGTVVFDLNVDADFSAAGYTFAPGSNVSFEIYTPGTDGRTYTGSSNGDFIVMSIGDETVFGGDGNDTIQFGNGQQLATGGSGADNFRVGMGQGVVTDFTIGEDRIDMSETGLSLMSRFNDLSFVDTPGGAALSADAGGVHYEILLQGIARASVTDSHILLGTGGTVEIDFGTGFNDLLFGFALNDELHGAGGNDRIYGGGGIDRLYGDDGDDVIILDGSIAFGGTYDGGTGTDTLLLRPDVARAPGQGAQQYFIFPGAPGTGLIAVERLVFESGVGADNGITFVTTTSPTFTEVAGGAGNDGLFFVALAGGTYAMPSVTLSNWSASDTIGLVAQSGASFAVTFNGRNDISQVLLGALGDDTLNGGALGDVLRGGGGADILNGGGGLDVLLGEDGNDRLVLGSGATGATVDGGAGTDTFALTATVTSLAVFAGIEAVELSGGAGLTLTAAQFNSTLGLGSTISGTGSLTVNMAVGDFQLFLQTMAVAGGSTLTVTVNGSDGGETIKGANGATNTISTGGGSDVVRGGNRADIINGGDGDDKLAGAAGADLLTGGAGADTFRFQSPNTTGLGAAADQITDFVIGTDRLAFQAIDADLVTPGDQAFSFLGTGAFANTGVGQIRYQDSGANLLVQIDSDGNGVADMEVVLQGLAGQVLTIGDFLL